MLDRPASVDGLRGDEVIWITTSSPAGQPQSSPVWFHWDGDSFLLYSRPDAVKVANIIHRPQVALHLNGGEPGTTVVSIEGVATIDTVPRQRRAAYVDKYRSGMARLGTDPESYLADFSTPIVVRPHRMRRFESK